MKDGAMPGRGLRWKKGFQKKFPEPNASSPTPGAITCFVKQTQTLRRWPKGNYIGYLLRQRKTHFTHSTGLRSYIMPPWLAATTSRVTVRRTVWSFRCESVRGFPPVPFWMDATTNFARCFAISYGVLFSYLFVGTLTRPLDKTKKNVQNF